MAIEGSKKSSSQPPRKINVQKFAESRATELESLHSTISTRLNNDFRSRRNKRRRTTAFDSQVAKKRNRKRLRLVDKSKVSGLETEQKKNKSTLPRCVRRRLELKKNPETGFVTSGDGTKRLRTHVWHAKRFTMTKRWGFYLPLGYQGRGRGSRAVLRWFKQGALIHDASYNDSLVAVLQMVLLPSPSVQSEGVSDSVLSGITYGAAMLHHVGAPLSKPIAPVTYMWRPYQQSKEDDSNSFGDHVETEPSRISYHSCFRQLWIWIHASAFSEGYDALKCACHKLMSERDITINCFSREGQLAKLELIGSKAFQLIQKTVSPVTCIVENPQLLKKCSFAKDGDDFQRKNSLALENEEIVSNCAILSFTIKDPRILPAKRATDFPQPDSILDMQEVEADDHANLTRNLDKNEEFISASFPKPEGNEVLFENKNLWDANCEIDPPEEENVLCMEKHQQRMDFFYLDDPKSSKCGASSETDPQKPSNKAPCLHYCPILVQKNNTKVYLDRSGRWSIILPISWVRVFWVFLISKGAHAIGLREKHWIACENGLPCFPPDYPDCNAYLSLKETEATASRQIVEQRPPAIRPFRIPIPPPWDVVHITIDKLSLSEKEAQTSGGENMVGRNPLKNSNCGRSIETSFGCHNSFDSIIARTSSMLTDFLNGIHGEKLLLFPHFQNRKSSLVRFIKDKTMTGKGQNGITQINHSSKLCFVRVHLHAFKGGVFEDGAVVCAPCLTDISLWTSSTGRSEGGLEMPESAVGSYFKEQSSGKWELHEPKDPASEEYHRWPVGFVTTGFVRGSKRPMAVAFCDAVLLACLREKQWKEMPVNRRRKEIYVLVRNLRSSAYRLALATIVLEQHEEDLIFL
ncbi:Ribonuclease P/MRP, subunit POP1 [Corchorus olitorius]|uniref:Ribonuclease P/MRP, subunit POP1 n=1 Tax=Corchorus olitorius TaxID=93759 RepID=A0A1R3IHP3_9ROSI|nr:Ribonuclease P/MRP, subunit POP1 [Corchorus olitorius]